MRVDLKDIEKFVALNKKLKEFTALQGSLQFKQAYEPKFKNILMCSASKLVGCDAKIKMNPRDPKDSRYGNMEYVITRQGIKESFGYTGDFKARFIPNVYWIHDYVSENEVTCFLVKFLNNKELQSKEALKVHLRAREDISKADLDNENYAEHIKSGLTFTIYGSVEEGAQDCTQATSELVLTTTNSWASKNIVLAEPGSIFINNNSYGGKSYNASSILAISIQATFIEYLRISEEPTYTQLMDLLQEHITKCQKHITTKQTALEEITNKYGQYLVFKEL